MSHLIPGNSPDNTGKEGWTGGLEVVLHDVPEGFVAFSPELDYPLFRAAMEKLCAEVREFRATVRARLGIA